jgi:hypothetical protein
VGTTKVVVSTNGRDAWQLTVVVLSATPQERVRAALVELAEVVLDRPST